MNATTSRDRQGAGRRNGSRNAVGGAHGREKSSGNVNIAVFPRAQFHRRLVGPVEVRSAGRDQCKLFREALQQRTIGHGVVRVRDFQTSEAHLLDGTKIRLKRGSVREGPKGVRERWESAGSTDSLDRIVQIRLATGSEALSGFGQELVE